MSLSFSYFSQDTRLGIKTNKLEKWLIKYMAGLLRDVSGFLFRCYCFSVFLT